MNSAYFSNIETRSRASSQPLISTTPEQGGLCSREAANRCGRFSAAFTLLEVLVIAFTIGVLLLLFLPALAGSKSNVGRVVCSNNLRQLGTAAFQYAQENRNYLAFPNWDGGGTYGSFGHLPGWLYTSTNGPGAPGGIPDPGPGGGFETHKNDAYKKGLWWQYMPNPKAYLCPADTKSRSYQIDASKGGRNNRMSSYVMNGAVCGYGGIGLNGRANCRITDVWNPECYLLWGPDENSVGPGDPGAWCFNDGAMFPDTREGMLERLHTAAGCEILTVSGNVHFVTRSKYKIESAAAGKSLAWWSPFSATGH